MKKFLFTALIAVLTVSFVSVPTAHVQAQSAKSTPSAGTKTITTADTTTFQNVQSKLESAQYSISAAAGTVTGTIYLEVSDDNLGWKAIDSTAVTNTTAVQVLYHEFTRTSPLHLRFRFTNTGGQTCKVKATIVRRTDE